MIVCQAGRGKSKVSVIIIMSSSCILLDKKIYFSNIKCMVLCTVGKINDWWSGRAPGSNRYNYMSGLFELAFGDGNTSSQLPLFLVCCNAQA